MASVTTRLTQRRDLPNSRRPSNCRSMGGRSHVERASRTRAWAAARDYFAKRYTGAELEYALAELEQVEREAQAEAA